MLFATSLAVLALLQTPPHSFSCSAGLAGYVSEGDKTQAFPLYPGRQAILCADERSYNDYSKSLRAGDSDGIRLLLSRSRALPLPENTDVLVIKVHFGADIEGDNNCDAAEVRVLEGEHKSRAGWISLSELRCTYFDWSAALKPGSRGKIRVDGKAMIDKDTYNQTYYSKKTDRFGLLSPKVNGLTKQHKIADVKEGVAVEVVELHPRETERLTEPAIEVKFLSGPLKGKRAFVYPTLCVSPRR